MRPGDDRRDDFGSCSWPRVRPRAFGRCRRNKYSTAVSRYPRQLGGWTSVAGASPSRQWRWLAFYCVTRHDVTVWADHFDGATMMSTVRRLLIQRALGLVGWVSVVLVSQRAALCATAGDVLLVHHSFSVQVVAVDPGITEIAPFDFYEIAYTINQSVTDQNNSIGAGTFPALARAFSLAARPLNALPWHPMGTFNLAGSNYVTNAFGDNYTFQMKGSGFPDGGPGLAFFDLDLNWSWPSGISDSGLNDQFAVQLVGGGVVDLTRA